MMRTAASMIAWMFAWSAQAATIDTNTERAAVEQWRAARVAELTGEQGWLSLVGLFWLDKGENTFGRAPSNRLVFDHPALAATSGSFFLDIQGGVHFTARPDSGVTHDGMPVSTIDLVPDTKGSPTTLASGPLRFFIIERSGKRGVRVRDLDSPRRRNFAPIEYYPIDATWVFDARFEPYVPVRRIRIVNILGLESELPSPGAIVFERDGREWRLDTILEQPGDETLFVMFSDGTSGKETYGAGRFLRIPLPSAAATRVDFNESYNPPCAFNDFSTCPLPPYQNRLTLRVEAGEKKHGASH